MSMVFNIVGKNKRTTALIHRDFIETRVGMGKLMLNRVFNIAKTNEGAKLTIRNKNLIAYINANDVIKRICDGFPNDYDNHIDYEVEQVE